MGFSRSLFWFFTLRGDVAHEVGNTLKFLAGYSQDHFVEDEKIRQAIDYDGIERDKELHRKFFDDIPLILVDLKKGRAVRPLTPMPLSIS